MGEITGSGDKDGGVKLMVMGSVDGDEGGGAWWVLKEEGEYA